MPHARLRFSSRTVFIQCKDEKTPSEINKSLINSIKLFDAMIEASKHLVMFLAAAAVLYMLARGSRGVGLAPWIPSSRLPAG